MWETARAYAVEEVVSDMFWLGGGAGGDFLGFE